MKKQIAMYGCTVAVVAVLYDEDWDEYVCQLYRKQGEEEEHVYLPRADYYTDDEGDARATARAMLKPYLEGE